MNYFYIFGMLVSVIIYLIVGLWAGRSIKNVDDYYVCGRRAPTILVAGTMFASMLSVNGFMGDQGWCYTGNITSLVLINALCSCGYIFGPLVFGIYLRRSACNTMPEYFCLRFQDDKIRQVAGVITAVSLVAYLIACITGVGILMKALTGWSTNMCYVLAWACFTLFTFYSGSEGVLITDTMMFLVFLFAALIAGPYIFNAQGGLGDLLTNLMNNVHTPENMLDYYGNIPGTGATTAAGSLMYSITLGLVWMITVSVSPWQAGRNLMAKNEHVILRSGAISAVCTTAFLLYLNLQSISVINLNPSLDDPQNVLIWAAMNVMPKAIALLLLTGIMAAGLSSASTFLSVVGFSLTSDVFPVSFASDAHKLRISRLVIIAVSLLSLLLACMGFGSIRIVAWLASTIIAASWAVPGIGGILFNKMSAEGARWSMVSGFFSYLGFRFLKEMNFFGAGTVLVNMLDPFYIAICLSLFFAWYGSWRHPASEKAMKYHLRLLVEPKAEKSIQEFRRDVVYGIILMLSGVFVTIFLLFGWAIPYNY